MIKEYGWLDCFNWYGSGGKTRQEVGTARDHSSRKDFVCARQLEESVPKNAARVSTILKFPKYEHTYTRILHLHTALP